MSLFYKILLLNIFLFPGVNMIAQISGTINFNNPANWTASASGGITSWQTDHQYNEQGWNFTLGDALRNGSGSNDGFPNSVGATGHSWRVRNTIGAQLRATLNEQRTVISFSFFARRWDSNPGADWNVFYTTNGGANLIPTGINLNNSTFNNSSDWREFTFNVPSPVLTNAGDFFVLFVRNGGERILIDNFSYTYDSGAPKTQVRADFCDQSITALGTNIYVDPLPGVVMYRYRINNGSTTVEYERDRRWFNLITAGANPQYETIYTISVALDFGQGFGAYGSSCTVTTPDLPITQLRSDFCDEDISSLGTNIYTDPVPGALFYRYRIVWDQGSTEYERDKRWFNLITAGANPQYETIYEVEVAYDMGTGFSSYGPLCTVTTPTESEQLIVNNTIQQLEGAALEEYLKQVGLFEDYEEGNKSALLYTPSKELKVAIYPNPSGGEFNIQINKQDDISSSTISVYDATGREVYKLKTENSIINFGENLNAGVYLVTVESNNVIKNIKVIKK